MRGIEARLLMWASIAANLLVAIPIARVLYREWQEAVEARVQIKSEQSLPPDWLRDLYDSTRRP